MPHPHAVFFPYGRRGLCNGFTGSDLAAVPSPCSYARVGVPGLIRRVITIRSYPGCRAPFRGLNFLKFFSVSVTGHSFWVARLRLSNDLGIFQQASYCMHNITIPTSRGTLSV